MNLNTLISNLTPKQVEEILIGDGIEMKDSISDVKKQGDCLYTYKVFSDTSESFSKKLVKITLDPYLNFFTVEYKKITRH